MSVRIAIAQCAPALGAVKRNLDMHLKWIARAKAAGSPRSKTRVGSPRSGRILNDAHAALFRLTNRVRFRQVRGKTVDGSEHIEKGRQHFAGAADAGRIAGEKDAAEFELRVQGVARGE